MMKKVFICSPYRGDVERNVALAKAHARFAARCGYCPVVPHLMYPQFLKDSDPDERILGITLGVELMKISNGRPMSMPTHRIRPLSITNSGKASSW